MKKNIVFLEFNMLYHLMSVGQLHILKNWFLDVVFLLF